MHRGTGLMRAIPRAATKARRANGTLLAASRSLVTAAKPVVAPLLTKCALPRFTQPQVAQRECTPCFIIFVLHFPRTSISV